MGGEEADFVNAAFNSNYVAPLGPMVDGFEDEFAEYTGIPHCLALSSGTAAMHLAMRELGIGQGDSVIASSMTFIGSVTPAVFLGAELRFVDSDARYWNMDLNLLEDELKSCATHNNLPKAVVPTDLYGQCINMSEILRICDRYDVPVIADSAEAVGARCNGKHAGCGARAAVFSFNGNKIITTSGGGMLASEDESLIEHARKLSQQAREPAPHYEHKEIGYNYRMSNIVAAIGRGQLRVLDKRVERRRRIFERYKELLGDVEGIEFMPEAPYGVSNRWLTVILIDPEVFGATREDVRLALEAENIESRPVWKPMHLQPVFKDCAMRGGAVSEDLFNRGLCLPSGTAMTDADIERVAGIVKLLS